MSTIISATIIINLILSLFLPGQIPSYARTVNSQTGDSNLWDDWSLSTTIAGDPPLASGSTSISVSPSGSAGVSGTGTSSVIELTSASYTATDDGDFSTTGSATGGGFGNGTNSSTAVSGSGTGASVSLTKTVTANTWSTMTVAPAGVYGGGSLAYDGSGNIYAFQGNVTTAFWKYAISS
ncbi:MAG: Cysteine proteinase, partial [Parcubacteria group bacterium GW2011_GWD2_38_12]